MNELNDAENSASSKIPSCSPAPTTPSYSRTLISSPPSRMPIMPKYSPSYPPISRSCDPNSSRSPTSCNNEMDLNENEVMAENKSLDEVDDQQSAGSVKKKSHQKLITSYFATNMSPVMSPVSGKRKKYGEDDHNRKCRKEP